MTLGGGIRRTMLVNKFRRAGSTKVGVEKSAGSTFLGSIFGTKIEEGEVRSRN